MSIRSKLLVLMLLVGLISAAVVGSLSYKNARTSLTKTIYDQLTATRETKKRQTENYFKDQLTAFEVLSNQGQVADALEQFNRAFHSNAPEISAEANERLKTFYKTDFLAKLAENSSGEPVLDTYYPNNPAALYRQAQFISENPAPTGSKESLVSPNLVGTDTPDENPYARAHAAFHPLFVRMLNKLEYYDIFLIDHKTGDIVYSVFKEADYATSLTTGPYKFTGLARAFENVRRNPELGKVVIVDFDHYAPSYNKPAAFMATPVFDGTTLRGIIAAQLNIDAINSFMTSEGNWAQEGMGTSGEVYLVGGDKNLRTSSRFLIEDKPGYIQALQSAAVPSDKIMLIENTGIAILNQPVTTTASENALRGQSATEIVKDYRGVDVLSSYAPIEIGGMRWAILAEKDVSEAMVPLHHLRNQLLLILGAIAIAVTLFSLLAAQIFARPIAKLEANVDLFTAGKADDLTLDTSGTDEFSSLSRAFNTMIGEIRGHNEIIEKKNIENERLLRTVLPDVIADRVRGGEVTIGETFENVTVVYATIGRFAEIMADVSAGEMLTLLNELVDAFDEASERHGVERISTIGDAYIAACGLPIPRLDHTRRALELAQEMVTIVTRFNRTHDLNLTISVGLATGEVDAGIVGKRKFVYEILGESVTLSRLLATESPIDTISVTEATLANVKSKDIFKRASDLKSDSYGSVKRWVTAPPKLIDGKASKKKGTQ